MLSHQVNFRINNAVFGFKHQKISYEHLAGLFRNFDELENESS